MLSKAACTNSMRLPSVLAMAVTASFAKAVLSSGLLLHTYPSGENNFSQAASCISEQEKLHLAGSYQQAVFVKTLQENINSPSLLLEPYFVFWYGCPLHTKKWVRYYVPIINIASHLVLWRRMPEAGAALSYCFMGSFYLLYSRLWKTADPSNYT